MTNDKDADRDISRNMKKCRMINENTAAVNVKSCLMKQE